MKEEESCTPRLSVLSNPWEVEADADAEAQGMKTPPLIPPHSIAIPFKWEEIPGKPIQPPRNQTLTHSKSLHLPPRLQPLQVHSTSIRRSSSLSYSSTPPPPPPPPLCIIHHWPPTTEELLAKPCSLSYSSPSPTLGKKGILIRMKRTSALFAAILNRIRISLKKGR
ncbi:uncharacterized protein LOC131060206 [Cryptomeria japonica]|uniref:uncharacterized protein LOC131060206 n=1 Tax=Cryptomeria japonica TaxID=3369 RepID=UPI0025AC857B|nr:uncharacterized protein LOC131060206 [Cryptomeria japonica]